MSKKQEIENLLNPVGSIQDESHYEQFYGKLGGLRHAGYFSDDNPYIRNIYTARNNQDIDALYSRAEEWEADRVNLLEQRQFDRAVLEEQREYDLPINDVIRQRQAGINPDLVGSGSSAGSGGSSAQMAHTQMADQQSDTPFMNSYDNANIAISGVNTVANTFGQLVSGYSAIADTICKFKMLPSQIKLNESAAGLQDAQGNEITSLLSGKKKSLDIGNSLQYVNLISNLSGMIKADATDDEFNALVSAAGIDPTHAAPTISAIKQAQSTPGFLQGYRKDILAAREAEAELEVYTSDVFHRVIEDELELQELQLDFGIITQSMQNKVQTFLQNSPGYLENLADIQSQSAGLAADQLELAKDQFKRDLSAYQSCLDAIVDGVKQLESRNAELMALKKANGREFSPQEQLEYDTNLMRINRLYSLGSQEVNNAYGIVLEANRQRYYLESNSNYNRSSGSISGLGGSGLSDEAIIYGNIAFGDIVRGVYTTHELIQQYSNIALNTLSVGAQFFMGARLGRSPLGYRGGVGIPTSKRVNPTTEGGRVGANDMMNF